MNVYEFTQHPFAMYIGSSFVDNYKCAIEGEFCKCNGDVYIGEKDSGSLDTFLSNNYKVLRNIKGGVYCKNSNFRGDPLPDV